MVTVSSFGRLYEESAEQHSATQDSGGQMEYNELTAVEADPSSCSFLQGDRL